MSFSIVPQKPHEGSLAFDPTPNCCIIDDSFIFIITHQSMEENVKIPLAIGFVRKEDFCH